MKDRIVRPSGFDSGPILGPSLRTGPGDVMRASAWLALIPVVFVLGGLGQSPAQARARTIAVSSMPVQGDEFVGPFPSWTNLKTAYGAAGDGMADDTAAVQSGLDEVALSGRSPVLFI